MFTSVDKLFNKPRAGEIAFIHNRQRRLLVKPESFFTSASASVNLTTPSKGFPRTFGLLKVHKAASTTTQGIFMRYGYRRNLTFVLPPEINIFGYPNIISLNESVTSYNTLRPPPGKTFDILCHHVIYNAEAWSTVLPDDAAIVGTIREPFSFFRSSLNYFNPKSIFKLARKYDDPVSVYMKNPLRYERHSLRYSFINNRQALEYGVDPKVILNRDFYAFNTYLREVLDKKFTLVLVAERFEESLVLMKRKFNWTFYDIVYTQKNVRNGFKEDRYTLTDENQVAHKQFAVFDYLLYEFFSTKLDLEIQNQDTSFAAEVKHLKLTRSRVEGYCNFGQLINPALKIRQTDFHDEFTISKEDCGLMNVLEITFTQEIRRRQYGKAFDWPVRPSRN